MKPCIHCKQIKPLGEFYCHPMMGDGHLNVCKPCKRLYARTYAKTEAGYANAAKRQRTERRHLWQDEYERKRRAMSPEKFRARNTFWRALKNGKILKQPKCQFPRCEFTKVEGHHDDYSRPLEILWLCKFHHRQRDIEIGRYPHIKKVV